MRASYSLGGSRVMRWQKPPFSNSAFMNYWLEKETRLNITSSRNNSTSHAPSPRHPPSPSFTCNADGLTPDSGQVSTSSKSFVTLSDFGGYYAKYEILWLLPSCLLQVFLFGFDEPSEISPTNADVSLKYFWDFVVKKKKMVVIYSFTEAWARIILHVRL